MSDEPVLVSRLTDSFGVDFEFLNDTYSTYIEDTAERIVELQRFVAAQDAEQTSFFAHAIKGSSLNAGADDLAQLAGDLELLAMKGDQSQSVALTDAITNEFDVARQFILKYLDSICP